MIKRAACNFKRRGERRATKGEEDRVQRCEGNERKERRYYNSIK